MGISCTDKESWTLTLLSATGSDWPICLLFDFYFHGGVKILHLILHLTPLFLPLLLIWLRSHRECLSLRKSFFKDVDKDITSEIRFFFLFTSIPILKLLGSVNGSTGTPTLASAIAAASSSLCSLSLFFLFSSCKVKIIFNFNYQAV